MIESIYPEGEESVKKVLGSNNWGLTWWGDIVRVVFILLLILGGVIMGAISINGTVQEIM